MHSVTRYFSLGHPRLSMYLPVACRPADAEGERWNLLCKLEIVVLSPARVVYQNSNVKSNKGCERAGCGWRVVQYVNIGLCNSREK